MKGLTLFLLVYIAFSFTTLNASNLPKGYPETNRSKTLLNMDWKFHLGEPDAEYFKTDLDDSKWETVCVPHGMQLSPMNLDGFDDDKYQHTYLRDVAWYRRNVIVPQSPNNKIVLEFEGAHQVTDLWVNGKHVGQFAVSGYTPFHFDITNFVTKGKENQVTLMVDNRQRDDIPPDPGPFDYIKFAGLYRDVYLVEYDPLHITFNWEDYFAGVYITTPTVDPLNMNAAINIRTTVRNENSEVKKATIITRVIDSDGIVVLKLVDTKIIGVGADYTFNQIGSIEDNLRLWQIDDPYLYRVNSLVLDGDKPVDCIENRTGFRKVEMNNLQGIVLNGKPIKLIGMNRHQHYGFIGDAMPNSLHYKDMWQLKQFGINTMRTAHYPHDDAVLDACDELGILVYEEAPTWMSIGNDAWFDNYEIAARRMVRNHRNHPSIIIWGAGINHRGCVPRANNAIKQEDPVRFTASQDAQWTGYLTSSLTDIYAQMDYSGFYWNKKEPVLAMEGGGGPGAINSYKSDPMKLGMITWTAHAYYSFHDNKNNKTNKTRGGWMNVFRWDGGRLNWYPTEMLNAPYTYIKGQWKKDIEKVEVFSNAEKVELLLNDKPYKEAKLPANEKFKYLDHPPFYFEINDYKDGKLTANGITDGKIVSSYTIQTPEEAYKVKLIIDTVAREVTADGSDILVAYAQAVDKNGTPVYFDYQVKFSVKGPASIVGEKEGIGSNPMKPLRGAAPVLIQAGKVAGEITLSAEIKGLKPANASFKTIPAETDIIAARAKPIYDFEKIKVDIGEINQLEQFDWIPWYGKDNEAATMEFEKLGGFTAELKCVENNNLLRWLGEVNVIGKYGFAHGDGVLGMDPKGLMLELKGLKKGKYKITTSHHAPSTNSDGMDPNQKQMVNSEIFKLPCAKNISIEINDAKTENSSYKVSISEGESMMEEPFATSSYVVESDGANPVILLFKDADGNKGVWLNTFEITQWK